MSQGESPLSETSRPGRRRIRGRSRLVGFGLVALVLGCGGPRTENAPAEAGGLRRISVQHNWVKDVALAGIYCAAEKGFYRDLGLEVEVLSGGPGVDPVFPVLSGDALVGIHTNAASVLIPRSRGLPLKVIAAQYQRAPLGLVAKKSSGIESPEDFRGRRIGVIPTSVAILEIVLKLNGFTREDVEIVVVSPTHFLPLLLEDKVDLLLSFETNQPVELDLMGVPNVFFRFDDLGYRQESYPFFVSEETFDREQELLAGFLAATRRGWAHALENPEEAARWSVTKYTDGLDLVKETEVARRQASLMVTDWTRRNGLLYMNPETWARTDALLVETGMIDGSVALDELLSWELLEREPAFEPP